MTDDDFAKLVLRMLVIVENDSQWISKYRTCFVEGDPMFGHVRGGFLRIPLESQWHVCGSGQSRTAQVAYHCFNRCVQQAFLCGFDREHNVDYSHRKVWMREKLRRLARAFAVDVLKYSLSNPSWLMRVWCGHIGRQANQETGKSGRFFEERFKSVRLLDEAAVLACALYIDLNAESVIAVIGPVLCSSTTCRW